MLVFYSRFVCRLQPWPDEFTVGFKILQEDPTVYYTMYALTCFNIAVH